MHAESQDEQPGANGRPTQASIQPAIDFLRQHEPFNQLSPAHLEFLAKRLDLAFFAQGEVIADSSEGPASRLFIIKQGRVRGEPPQSGAMAPSAWELTTGECFPIGALLARRPVSTVHRAAEDCFCYELRREDFDRLLGQSPVFHDFCTRRMASLLDGALRAVQAASAARVSADTSLSAPVERLIRRQPVTCPPELPIIDALGVMDREHIGSLVVVDNEKRPVGVFTLHDVLSRVALPQRAPQTPMSEVMSRDPKCVAAKARADEAALLMTQHGIGHVCVVDDERLVGIVSERDLFSLQRVNVVALSRTIASADDIGTLAGLEKSIHELVEQMLAQGASVEQLTQIISTLNDNLTQRVITLVLDDYAAADLPPFTWLAFGSEGRCEQTLKTDQDNGILFDVPEGSNEHAARQALLPVADRINHALAQVGFPLCPGNIMASNPECCLSLAEWKARFGRWIDQGTPEHLLKATIFFDFRSIYGADEPAATLRDWLKEAVIPNSRFRRQMAANALQNRPPLGLIRDFRLSSKNTLDLKLHGVTPFVDGARVLSLANRVTETNTVARLRAVARTGAISVGDAEAWAEAYHYIQLLRMRHHRRLAEEGRPLDNQIDPDTLNELDRRILKEAFRQARKLQGKLALDYQL